MEFDKAFMKGLNHGYVLAHDNPQFLKTYFDSVGNSSYKSGLQKGQEIYIELKKKRDKKRGKGM